MALHCPRIKIKRYSLQKEALHDLGPVTLLAFAQDLLWGTPTSPWRPAPTSTAKRGLPGLLWPLLPLDFYLPIALRKQLKMTIQLKIHPRPPTHLQPLAHGLSSCILCSSTLHF